MQEMAKVQPAKFGAPPHSDDASNPNFRKPAWGNPIIVNEQAVQQNSLTSPLFALDQHPPLATFRASTIAPSPELPSDADFSNLSVDTSIEHADSPQPSSPLSAGLRIKTDMQVGPTKRVSRDSRGKRNSSESTLAEPPKQMSAPLGRTPSIKNVLASSYGSANSAASSAFSSPMLNAMADVTPLPSPLLSGDSPGPWKKLGSRPNSRGPMALTENSALVAANGESISSAMANQSKRRAFQSIGLAAVPTEPSPILDAYVEKEKNLEVLHVRNRSLSEYIPDPLTLAKPGLISVSGSHIRQLDATPENAVSPDTHLHREPHLAAQRGLAPLLNSKPPTPPSSRTGGESSDSDSSLSAPLPSQVSKRSRYEYFDAHIHNGSKRRWRKLKELGRGTFSNVVLATSQLPPVKDIIDENLVFGQCMDGIPTPSKDGAFEQTVETKSLVAVKICEHGPKGGASEERVEMSLKRELEIMKSIHHPSIVHLKAWSIEPTRAILILSYCPGGDLFDFASQHQESLSPVLLRRIFAELVGAVRYLHSCHIVHRDIKLENILINLPISEITSKQPGFDWTSYPVSLTTLTDLGLSRSVADDEKLSTCCGSDDYAAPELIMGQPYDGRATDAWSLGVLLYALLESRLPFDPPPPGFLPENQAHKQRSRTSHRIARVEWMWIRFAGQDGDHEGDEKKLAEAGLLGAMRVVEGLLRRAKSRWGLEKVGEEEWVKGGIFIDGGKGSLRFREEDEANEVDEAIDS